MADLSESNQWEPGIYQLETSDPVLGGPEGIDNKQAKQLANRTQWLKDQIQKILDGVTTVGKAAQLATARTLRFKGAATGSGTYDGSADTEITLALVDSGVVAGTYTKVTLNAKGIATGGSNPTALADYGVAFASQVEAETGADTNKPMSALRVFQAIGAKVIQATESALGIARIATQTAVNAGTDDTTVITPKKFSAGIAALVIQATEAITGIAKIGTQSQVNAGTDDQTIVTPKKLRLGFAISLGTNGYVVFPTWMLGLIIQWGVVNGVPVASSSLGATGPILDALFPIAFPTAALRVFGSMDFTTMSTTSAFAPGITIFSRSVIRVQNNYTASAGNISWWAVGY
jgi:hypothetical protein